VTHRGLVRYEPFETWGNIADPFFEDAPILLQNSLTCVIVTLDVNDLETLRPVLASVHCRGGVRVVTISAPLLDWTHSSSSRHRDQPWFVYAAHPSPSLQSASDSRADMLAALEREEDQAFEQDFLGSDSDVNEFPDNWCCPYLPSPLVRVERACAFLPITATELLVDLGCGDGRTLVHTVHRTNCHALGLELDAGLVDKARTMALERGVRDRCM
jgi:hypothetical protein